MAENKGSADLHTDLQDLVDRWQKLYANLKSAKPGKRVLGEVNQVSAVLRDVMTKSCTAIHVNDPRVSDEVKEFLAQSKSGDEAMVKLSRAKDLFNNMSIHRQIKAAFGRQVNLRSGSYLVIEQTEAMHVIDVNSGRKKGASSQEENALLTNLDVVPEIAEGVAPSRHGGHHRHRLHRHGQAGAQQAVDRRPEGGHEARQGQAQHRLHQADLASWK